MRHAALCLLMTALVPSPARAQCPAADEIRKQLAEAPLDQASRTSRFSVPVPDELYQKALEKIGEVETERKGDKGLAVAIAPLPVEVLWKAINDEAHHAEGDYLLVQRSEIIGGTPRGQERTVFQAGEKLGLGRFWVTQTGMSGELFAASGGRLWEVVWEGESQPKTPPVEDPPDLSPVEWTRGAWLLTPIGDTCTAVEHFSWSKPGGFIGMMQGMVLGKALRGAVEGMVRLADERYREPPPGPAFVRPDGQPLD